MSFKVERTEREQYDNCEKHSLKLVNNDNGETVTEQRVSFSHWQLEDDGYQDRVKQWAQRRTPDQIDKSKIDVPAKP